MPHFNAPVLAQKKKKKKKSKYHYLEDRFVFSNANRGSPVCWLVRMLCETNHPEGFERAQGGVVSMAGERRVHFKVIRQPLILLEKRQHTHTHTHTNILAEKLQCVMHGRRLLCIFRVDSPENGSLRTANPRSSLSTRSSVPFTM